ncbi:MAG: matrixin family metalloprotease, partial [Myxococcota bacterium]|nr:matrixin family metalloprotease [Myxococcota bacterium]
GVMCPLNDGGTGAVSIFGSNHGPVNCRQVGYNHYGGPNQHVIVFRDDKWPYSDASNTLGLTTVTFEADTGELYDADTEINGTVPLSVGDPVPLGGYDLESIVTHEMGHFLGLGHSSVSTATMYAQYNSGSTSMRTLTDDDVAGLCSIYPPNKTRNVDPSVAPGGSKAATPCDKEPRNGFSTECPQPKSGCTAASNGNGGEPGARFFFAALASAGFAWRRRRAPVPANSR